MVGRCLPWVCDRNYGEALGRAGLCAFRAREGRRPMKFTRQILGLIYESCGGHCFYCSIEIKPFDDWEPDHMTPRQQGGDDSLYNLVASCRTCNRRKGNRTVEQYRQYLHTRILNA